MAQLGESEIYIVQYLSPVLPLLAVIAFYIGLACGDFKTMLCGPQLKKVVHH